MITIDSTIVASRLKMARENKNLSKSEVAKALNIATSSMTYYEQGQTLPSKQSPKSRQVAQTFSLVSVL